MRKISAKPEVLRSWKERLRHLTAASSLLRLAWALASLRCYYMIFFICGT